MTKIRMTKTTSKARLEIDGFESSLTSSLPLNEACPGEDRERESRRQWKDWILASAGMTEKSGFGFFTDA